MRRFVFSISLIVSVSLPALGETDPYFKEQWALENSCQAVKVELDFRTNKVIPTPSDRPVQNIGLPARPISSPRKIKVAVLDTGISKEHLDLVNNISRNPGECRALEKYKKCLADAEGFEQEQNCDKTWKDVNNPEVDTDKNGYPLDCMGWAVFHESNATTGERDPVSGIVGSPEFGDPDGHGTHIAGVIAAEAGNGIGIRGCSQNVEILPVQVLKDAPSEPIKPLSFSLNPVEPESPRERPPLKVLGDGVARGIIYAIRSGAEVINLSIGWPESYASEYLQWALEEAHKKGVFIVAAAGNDSTKALLRPCIYPNVICVGSHDPDGAMSFFSNYGPGVDIAAPGLNILSTYTLERKPQRFREFVAGEYVKENYEYLHGTSQATPFVSCAVAEMLARGIPKKEVYPRLILGVRPHQKPVKILEVNPHDNVDLSCRPAENRKALYDKFTRSGNLDVGRSINVKAQPLILPAQKTRVTVKWNRSQARLQVPFKLKNFWAAADGVGLKVSVIKEHPDAIRPFVRSIEPGHVGHWSQGEEKSFVAHLEINDSSRPVGSRMPGDFELKVEVTVDGTHHRTSRIPVEVLVPVEEDMNDPEVHRMRIASKPKKHLAAIPIDHILDNQPMYMDYFMLDKKRTVVRDETFLINGPNGAVFQTNPKKWEITVHLLSQGMNGDPNGADYHLAGSSQKLEFVTKGQGVDDFSRLDYDFDGVSDYVYVLFDDRTLLQNPEPSVAHVFVFDHRMNLKNSYVYESRKAVFPYNTSLQVQWMKLGDVKVPTWMGFGQDPGKKPSLREAWKNRRRPREDWFWEEPQVRLFYLDQSGELHALQEYENYLIADFLTPSQEQILEGRIPVLLADPRGTERDPSYVIDFAAAEVIDGRIENVRPIALFGEGLTYRNLLDTRTDNVLALDGGNSLFRGTYWFGLGELKKNRISIFDWFTDQFFDGQIAALRGDVDAALWARFAFLGDSGPAAFVLTNSEIQYHDLGTHQAGWTSLRRYTFNQDMATSNYNFPFIIGNSGKGGETMLPALFTVEGFNFDTGIRFSVPHYNRKNELVEITHPARIRFRSGGGCQPIDQPFWAGPGRPTYLDFKCRDTFLRFPLTY